jgi:hypothetical protein
MIIHSVFTLWAEAPLYPLYAISAKLFSCYLILIVIPAKAGIQQFPYLFDEF